MAIYAHTDEWRTTVSQLMPIVGIEAKIPSRRKRQSLTCEIANVSDVVDRIPIYLGFKISHRTA